MNVVKLHSFMNADRKAALLDQLMRRCFYSTPTGQIMWCFHGQTVKEVDENIDTEIRELYPEMKKS